MTFLCITQPEEVSNKVEYVVSEKPMIKQSKKLIEQL